MRSIKHLLVLLILIFNASHLFGTSDTFTKETAEKLLFDTLKANTHWTSLPRFGLDQYNSPYFPNFYYFQAMWDNPTGSVNLGHYAVNKKTADIWEVIGCNRLSSKTIKEFQTRLMKRQKLSIKKFRKLSVEAPCSKD